MAKSDPYGKANFILMCFVVVVFLLLILVAGRSNCFCLSSFGFCENKSGMHHDDDRRMILDRPHRATCSLLSLSWRMFLWRSSWA